MLLWIPMILTMGCKSVNEDEAALVLNLCSEVFQDVQNETILIEDETVEFAITQGSSWEGSVMASGSRTVNTDTVVYPLSLSMVDVYSVDNDITLNGQLSFAMAYSIDPTDGVSYTIETNIDGELEVEGDAKGLADLLLIMTRNYNAESDQFDTQFSGTIGDIDASGL